jgi:hypothetical protein
MQIASHSGYVQIDWKRVEKDVNKAKRQIKKRANKAAPEINNIIEEVRLYTVLASLLLLVSGSHIIENVTEDCLLLNKRVLSKIWDQSTI